MISSVIAVNRLNGATRRIREVHTHTLGVPPIEYNYEAPLDVSQATLDANLVAKAISIDDNLADNDAANASESDNEVTATDKASLELVALAYLRKAYSLDDSLESYKKFDKFNNFRVAKGWSINQVVAGLSDAGLTQSEWDLMYARYAYLSNAQRVTSMQNYQLVMNGDIWSEG